MQDTVLSPSDFVALVNQTLEFAYPQITIEGELTNFRIAKNRWVYFDLQDEQSSVRFFGSVYQLPGPLADGMMVKVVGSPRLHPRFGFSINMTAISPVGEGAIKKAADLLAAKLEAEGLFAPERKRFLPRYAGRVGLITAAGSAAYADFCKVLNHRWGGVEVLVADVFVQGVNAPMQIVKAIEHLNQLPDLPEVIVVTRGGGSAEDLAAFSDERVVRAVAASRIPTLVAIGHEVDVCLAELAADARASTPSNAAEILVPDKKSETKHLSMVASSLKSDLVEAYKSKLSLLDFARTSITTRVGQVVEICRADLVARAKLVAVFDPSSALKRGYAVVRKNGQLIKKASQLTSGDLVDLSLVDGKIKANVKDVILNA